MRAIAASRLRPAKQPLGQRLDDRQLDLLEPIVVVELPRRSPRSPARRWNYLAAAGNRLLVPR
jgi:hypothetical protein